MTRRTEGRVAPELLGAVHESRGRRVLGRGRRGRGRLAADPERSRLVPSTTVRGSSSRNPCDGTRRPLAEHVPAVVENTSRAGASRSRATTRSTGARPGTRGPRVSARPRRRSARRDEPAPADGSPPGCRSQFSGEPSLARAAGPVMVASRRVTEAAPRARRARPSRPMKRVTKRGSSRTGGRSSASSWTRIIRSSSRSCSPGCERELVVQQTSCVAIGGERSACRRSGRARHQLPQARSRSGWAATAARNAGSNSRWASRASRTSTSSSSAAITCSERRSRSRRAQAVRRARLAGAAHKAEALSNKLLGRPGHGRALRPCRRHERSKPTASSTPPDARSRRDT